MNIIDDKEYIYSTDDFKNKNKNKDKNNNNNNNNNDNSNNNNKNENNNNIINLNYNNNDNDNNFKSEISNNNNKCDISNNSNKKKKLNFDKSKNIQTIRNKLIFETGENIKNKIFEENDEENIVKEHESFIEDSNAHLKKFEKKSIFNQSDLKKEDNNLNEFNSNCKKSLFIGENKIDKLQNSNQDIDLSDRYKKIDIENFKKYLNKGKQAYKISFLETLILPCISCKKKKKYRIFENIRNKTDDILDILRYMKEIIDLKRIKKIIFDENELKLLEYPYRLSFYDNSDENDLNSNESNNENIYKDLNLSFKRDSIKFKKIENHHIDDNESKDLYLAIADMLNNEGNNIYSRKIIETSSVKIQNYLKFIENK
jgi:hypothetical protein